MEKVRPLAPRSQKDERQAALVPRAELEGQFGDAHVGLQARLMSQALRKLAGSISKSPILLIFINQLREKVGVVYGSPEVTTGGLALKFYASVRLDVRKIDVIKRGAEVVGSRVRAKVVKNKLAPPFRQADFDLIYGLGISKEGALLDLAVNMGMVQKVGAWYSYGEERLGQGKEDAREHLKERPDVAAAIEKRIREALALSQSAVRAGGQGAGCGCGSVTASENMRHTGSTLDSLTPLAGSWRFT